MNIPHEVILPHPRPQSVSDTQSSEALFKRLVDRNADAILVLSLQGLVRYANLAAEGLFGCGAHELEGRPIGLPVCGDKQVEVDVLLPGGGRAVAEVRVHDSLWEGEPVVLASLRDVTSRTRSEAALRESEERYALAARAANDGLWDWDLLTDDVFYSPRWKSMLGAGEGEIGRRPAEWIDRVHPEDVERLESARAAHLEGLTSLMEVEHRVLHHNGSYRWVLCRAQAMRDEHGRATRLAGSLSDITHRKLAEAQLAHRAFYDPLTNLPNRALFLDRLRHALRRTARRKDYLFAVLFLDIDRFKLINDSLGHAAGDRLLVTIARRLELALRPGDSVARLGGDEFTVLLDDIHDVADARSVAERIHRELLAPFHVNGQELYTSASIGIALSATGYQRPEDILRDADTAMYRAKEGGRAQHAMFDTAMHARAVLQLQTDADLRRAVQREELRVQYQPIVSLSTGRIEGVEALVRWQHPERGLLSPADFVPMAEESGLIVQVDRWVLRHACREVQSWRSKMGPAHPFRLNVNLSTKQLSLPDLPQHVQQVLEETGIDPRTLRLEITESAIMGHTETAGALLKNLKEQGVQLSIDDFGTGYSSLSHLHRFPIDSVKVDRSFVDGLGSEHERGRIARAIVTVGQILGLNVTAEGVETTAQLEALRGLRCDAAQGYYFARPLDAEVACELIATGRRW